MARAVLHLELPGIYVAAARELALAPPDRPVLIHRRERLLDFSPLPGLLRGQSLRLARALVPHAVPLPVGVLHGAETYRTVWDELLTVGPALEPVAWHGGYVDVSGCLPRRGLDVYLARLAHRLELLTGVAPARGIGTSKLVARHASPLGRIVDPRETLPFLHAQHLRPDQGLTRAMIALLTELGCHRWGDVARVPEPRLQALFGLRGTILKRWSEGTDPRPVRSRYPPPFETVQAPLEPDDDDRWIEIFVPLTRLLAERLRRRGEVTTEVILALGGRAGWETFRRRLARGVAQAERLRTILLGLLPAHLDPWAYHELRVTLRGLRNQEVVQGVLFRDAEEERRQQVDDALSRVRSRYGLDTIGYTGETPPRERLAEKVWKLEGVEA
ncbi:MAG: hypothetical protein HYU66_05400 [Armatimonadetes bacterium]|nr:hypothetical protein [Armatimonadota bacterium]